MQRILGFIVIVVNLFIANAHSKVVAADYQPPFVGATALFQAIRNSLATAEPLSYDDSIIKLPYNRKISHVYLTLFQPGHKPLRWGTRKATLRASIARDIQAITSSKRFANFAVADAQQVRIMLEIVTAKRAVAIEQLSTNSLSKIRFEPGVNGLAFTHNNKSYFYLPTDGFVHSHLSMNQVLEYIANRAGIAKSGMSRKQKIALAKDVPKNYKLLRSIAYISYEDKVYSLYRGYPQPLNASDEHIKHTILRSAQWLLDNMNAEGKFLYFYDAAIDSRADFQHKNGNYYNILRHSGGIVALLRAYEIEPKDAYLVGARRAIAYLLGQTKLHMVDGKPARYVFYNRKSKLGGTGLGLVALMHYVHISGEHKLLNYAQQMTRHLQSRIDNDGEMIGYYIHPAVHNGEPLEDLTNLPRKKLFSFYYPGEALLGMALYAKYGQLTAAQLADVKKGVRKALDFLMYLRPKRYAEMFSSLPSDSWLMQAIEEWWAFPDMRNPDYTKFVYSDAKKMIAHMYNQSNALYPDYLGHFYYYYGQHPISDASRAEGLISAYYLAKQNNDDEIIDLLADNLQLIAKGLQQTYNSELASYGMPNPKQAIGSFRFKLTRQWVRVDSVQHALCFYARYYQALSRSVK